MDRIKQLLSPDSELIFIVMQPEPAVMTAFESNLGLVAFGETLADLKQAIRERVLQFFDGEYKGRICIRQFHDIVLD
ncbi:hypothetical protein SAMN05660226_02244 [Parapedobacter luteus]|uniref:Uncharacterized protein n=1 Tax=Parapedobacter luteus TaxID=623280 RepID=A0A1T5CHR8_9SPHI|nr:hypothetical protein [Parapedobacter luteus]SKB58999.1 hypothetical protein SAMN05660226_02244 [Parapedobacter luteus]